MFLQHQWANLLLTKNYNPKPQILFQAQGKSMNYSHKLYNYRDMKKFNALIEERLARHLIAIWNSHLESLETYVDLCHRFQINSEDRDWSCSDPNHAGYILIKPWTKQLMAHINAHRSHDIESNKDPVHPY